VTYSGLLRQLQTLTPEQLRQLVVVSLPLNSKPAIDNPFRVSNLLMNDEPLLWVATRKPSTLQKKLPHWAQKLYEDWQVAQLERKENEDD
jgi:hypothetical protein